jgi:glycine/D-amino acid oxidase-like deaminating enzyme
MGHVSVHPDFVVVGGCLVGAACAYELARDGHRVAVIDRHDTGRATDAGAGRAPALDLSPFSPARLAPA